MIHHVICLKWGDKYGPEYVNRLYKAVKRHTNINIRFWCFTDDPIGIVPEVRTEPLRYSTQLESWWNKLSLFGDNLPIARGERVFYVDLDTLVVSDIDELITCAYPNIVVLQDFYYGMARTAGKVGSGLMSWRHGDYFNVWNNFIRDPQAAIESVRPHGDQAWIEQNIGEYKTWQELYPNSVVSFKMHCRRGLSPGAKIVCYHGKPSIPESAEIFTKDWRFRCPPQPWVYNHWKD